MHDFRLSHRHIRRYPLLLRTCLAAALVVLLSSAPALAQSWQFTDVSAAAGARYAHGYQGTGLSNSQKIACGVAAGDYDNDGYVDLFVVRGDAYPHVLLHNKGNGTFENLAAQAGVAINGVMGCGALFSDLDGDGWLDLFVGGIGTTLPVMFRNNGDGTFTDVTLSCGIDALATFSACAGDYDRDGDLDLFLSHWQADRNACARLYRNEGNLSFVCVDNDAGTLNPRGPKRFGFSPNFVDIDNDDWLDILLASDFETSQVYKSNQDGTFTDVTDPAVITDQNGMGAAIGDYDNDGDLDWFVTSIWDPFGSAGGPPLTGNRFYRNKGNGTFEDATDETGTRLGGWGWGASFADFDNDGHLDIVHVNGWIDPLEPEFARDPAPLFMSNGDGTFTDRATELNFDHTGQGRGIVCFDYDRDGDIDVFVVSVVGNSTLFRNSGGNRAGNYLTVKLRGNGLNTEAIGARIYATSGGVTQMRELRSGNNFVSQNPAEAHFGLADATSVETLTVKWPDGTTTEMTDVAVNQFLTIEQPSDEPTRPPSLRPEILGVSPNPSNPFKNQFSIEVGLPAGASGTVVVYDVAGRAVATIARVASPNGEFHTISWDGTGNDGAPVPSGVYFLRAETNYGRSDASRIVVVR